jgi:hypothetical protein
MVEPLHPLGLASFSLLGLLAAAACGAPRPEPSSGRERAAPVPVIVLTAAREGAVTVAEAGDWVEVRLPDEDPAWRLEELRGDARHHEPQTLRRIVGGSAFQCFRLRVSSAGRLELVFRRRGDPSEPLSFELIVR